MRYKTFRNIAVAATLVGALGIGALLMRARTPSARALPAPVERPRPEERAATPEVPPAEAPPAPPAGEAPASAAADVATSDSVPLRPMDEEILARVPQGVSAGKGKDVFPGRAYKVNMYQDGGFASVNRLKIDLDRDEKWDEKWTFVREGDRDEVKRQVAPADDDVYTEEYRLRAGAWARKLRAD